MIKLSQIFRPFNLPAKNKLLKVFSEKDTTSKGYKLLLNYGLIHHDSTGMYDLLPMGQRVIDKLILLVERNMKLIGAQKMTLPLLTKQKLWEKSGTYFKSSEELYHVVGRDDAKFLLSPTHEQSFSNLMSKVVLSYKDFPKLLYQIGPKFRDEHRPKLGLLRSKEFIMQDLYSFDLDRKSAEKSYEAVTKTYENIFDALDIPYSKVIGVNDNEVIQSHEYFYESKAGDDKLYRCLACKATYPPAVIENRTTCPNCSLTLNGEHFKGIEVAHTFYFGTHYSDRLGSCYVDWKCKKIPLHMCSYGIGVSRLLSAVSEMMATDNDELRWPLPMAPYLVCVIPPKKGSREEFEVELQLPDLYKYLQGIPSLRNEIVIDDRTETTIGKRLMEAKLFGFPFIIVAGKDSTQNTPLFELFDINKDVKYLMPKSSLLQYLMDRSQSLTEKTELMSYISSS